jgi:hypothetical protein
VHFCARFFAGIGDWTLGTAILLIFADFIFLAPLSHSAQAPRGL